MPSAKNLPNIYVLEYEVKDFSLEPMNNIVQMMLLLITKWTCHLTIENSHSMIVSKSFTSLKMNEIAAGYARADAIFCVASTASFEFEYSHSWGSNATEEEKHRHKKHQVFERNSLIDIR